ncbi:MAG: acyl-CoA dehydrogenase family protein [Candidatus Brachytrichaceae bacterium NZ_4S206]|jgi:alkylation response protein AidB-like acyl-CoA dehydrogenase
MTGTEDLLTGERLVERMTERERENARRVERVLPVLRANAEQADRDARFQMNNLCAIRDAGLLGLIVPERYGGLGGTLRDLCAATFAMGTACPSTALAYFFHCTSASRGLLPLEAIEAGLYTAEEVPVVRAFAEKLLRKMGERRMWLANFASESGKTEGANVTISTEAAPVEGGWRLNGVKSFGCATGVADEYLVTAKLAGSSDVNGLALFFVPRDAEGVSPRAPWQPIGMRATATDGIVLKDVFVPADEALTIPGAFARATQMSRGTWVGNQVAIVAVYLGVAQACYDHTIRALLDFKFQDTGRSIATSPMHQELISHMAVDLETGYLWLRRQLELETSEPPLKPKAEVAKQWRMCKGQVCEAAFRVALNAFKASGTSGSTNSGVVARALRDLSMGLVQAFPAERGRLEVAKMIAEGAGYQGLDVKR